MQPQDNVAVVLKEFSPGQEIKVGEDTITILDKMTMGHKITPYPTLVKGAQSLNMAIPSE